MTAQVIGQYRVVRQLGEGGMGVVYEVVNDMLGKRAALKLLHPEYSQNQQIRARFFNEARASNLIQHPGLVNIFEFGQTPDGALYLVMEYLEGESLRQRLRRSETRLSPATAVKLVRQMASALAAAHQKRIVHRDLKPDNVMIVSDSDVSGGERTKILDFGIAKLIEEVQTKGPASIRTNTGIIMGTPAYMSPEQCRGAGAVTEKSDVYSLGIILYEMLSGQVPFSGEGAGELVALHIFQPPPLLQEVAPGTPSELVELVHTMLIKTATQRPSMAEVVQALDRVPISEISRPGIAPAYPVPRTNLANETTYSNLAGTKSTPTKAKSRLVALAAVPFVGLLAVGAWRAWTHESVSPRLRAEEQTAAAPAVKRTVAQVEWEVTSEPSSASLLRASDQRLLGKTPWRTELNPGAGTEAVVVQKAGYVEKTLLLERGTSQKTHVTLDLVPIEKPRTARSPANGRPAASSPKVAAAKAAATAAVTTPAKTAPAIAGPRAPASTPSPGKRPPPDSSKPTQRKIKANEEIEMFN